METFFVAIRAIFANLGRSILTMLGIVIGVAAVIAMMAVGAGARQEVEAAFSALGTNVLILLPAASAAGGVNLGFGTRPTITWDDLAAIREVETVANASPILTSSTTIVAESQNWTTRVSGTSPEYFAIRGWPLRLGVAFDQVECDGGAKVAVVGQTVVDRLYGANADPIGKSIRIRGVPFQIIGVPEKKGQSSSGQDYDDTIIIPYTTYAQRLQGGLAKFIQGMVMLQGTSAETTSAAERDVRGLLRERHRIRGTAEDDFNLRNLADIAGAREEGTRTMTLLLASVAAIALVVGGIGIMNIMLVGVTERTREIGLRLAVGATPGNILAQFLVEAISLSTGGGLLGVALGIGVADWIAAQFHWATVVQPEVIAVAVAFSATVGIVFGAYPARKASQLVPLEALRFE